MKKLFLFLIPLMVAGCKTVPLTGRKQISLIPSSQVRSLSADQYQEVLNTSQVVTGTQQSKMLKEVGHNIQKAVERYLNENGHSELLEGYDWEFNLIQSNQVNAGAMPGGR
ncbi:MAG: hypothetical protein U5L96_10460 [Owenweeksia sp.]|nr:hypothetical protein [Owenweeksia sp.]